MGGRQRGWQGLRGGERLHWCDACAVPLLGERCGRCGSGGRALRLSPPGDVRPASAGGLRLLAGILERDFSLPSAHRLLEGRLVLYNRVSGLDRADQVIADGRNVGTLLFDPVSREHELAPGAEGASMLVQAGARHLRLRAGAVLPRHVKGKTVPLDLLEGLEGRARPGKELLLGGRDLAASGRLTAGPGGGPGGFRVRDAGARDVRFSASRASLEDAVAANRRELEGLEFRARREIRSVLEDNGSLPLTVAFSGGKDSLAALELARRARLELERNAGPVGRMTGGVLPAFKRGPLQALNAAGRGLPPLTVLFSNTGLEFPETVEYIRSCVRELGLPLIEGSAGPSFWENLQSFGLPAKDFRWCCKVCKLAPMTRLVSENFPRGCLTVEGRRRRESFARQGIELLERNPFVPGQLGVEPIREWTALAVWLYIRWRGLRSNPLYDEDLERIGCWMCPSSLESEFETLRRTHPDLHSRWSGVVADEGRREGADERALRAGSWRWRSLPPKMRELARREGWKRPGQRKMPASLLTAEGISPCLAGGYTVEAVLRLPSPAPLERTAGVLATVGEVRHSAELGVALVRRADLSAKLFEGGQVVVTGPGPEAVRAFLKDVVGAVLRASRCTGCGTCERACPEGAVKVRGYPATDASSCTRCLECARCCVLVREADLLVGKLGRRS